MNYIRTKDGIYQLADTSGSNMYGEYHYYDHTGHNEFTKEVIKAPADTIEELCDEFVVCHNGRTICQFDKDVWDYEQIKYLGASNDFYGAIWTDKGLIFVAKMNDKGELELI